MTQRTLSPNTLAFLALTNEYCQALENARETDRQQFVDEMLRLLPRIYISASDLDAESMVYDFGYIPGALEEDYYDSVRSALAALFGEDDAYLEVFEDDMKYSDTPIAATVSEGLADLFQEFYNMLENVKDATDEVINETLAIVKENFASYWSQQLCNVLRAVNALKYK